MPETKPSNSNESKIIKKMERRIVYANDFALSFNFPLSYWKGHYTALRSFGYDTVMLFVAGTAPLKGFEQTVEWECNYIPELCAHIQKLGMKVILLSGVFNWLGMSPGFIRMTPELEAEWPETWNKQWLQNSYRRALCSTKAYKPAMEYVKALWNLYPAADGFAMEFGCEKPHCQCAECQKRGHWKIEMDFLNEFSEWVWQRSPNAEIIRNLGYKASHAKYPDSLLYQEMAKLDSPKILHWYTRPEANFETQDGKKHYFNSTETYDMLGKNGFMHHMPNMTIEEIVNLAFKLGLKGINGHPDERYMFLPEYPHGSFGFIRRCGPPLNPIYDHWLFRLRGFHYKYLFDNPTASYDDYKSEVISNYTGNAELAQVQLLLEDLIIDKKVPAKFFADENFYMIKDGLVKDITKDISPSEMKLLKGFMKNNNVQNAEYKKVKNTTKSLFKILGV